MSKSTKTAEPAFEMPEFDLTKMNEYVREFAEKNMSQNKEFYEKVKTSAEEAGKTFEETYEAMVSATNDLAAKSVENTKSNLDAGAKFFEAATGVKSVAELFELQSSFFRSQFEVFSKQAREVQDLSAKHGEKALAPAKAAFEKSVL